MLVSMAYPTVYIQEPQILQQSGEWLGKFGKKLFIITGRNAWVKAGTQVEESLKMYALPYELHFFNGECTYEEAERLLALLPAEIDLIVAIGGGQCMDTAKIVAHRSGLKMATIATLASTCASTTPLSIMYKPGHEYLAIEYFDFCPVLTLVDPQIIAEAPYRYLIAGIGDTLAKWYEATPINAGKFQNAKTRLGLKTAELAKDLLMEFSEQAIAENKKGHAGDAIRQIIDTNILLAGLVGGIGNHTCRGSGAHAFHNGMTCIDEIHGTYHGELVAFGIVCQLMLEQKPEEQVAHLMRFYRLIGLPVSLFDMGVTAVRDAELRLSAQRACDPNETIHYLPFPVLEDNVYAAIYAAHELGERLKAAEPARPSAEGAASVPAN
ncbi:iron-containing alcohol dehydrogenase family protein [Paenibacillus agricola]|uniref:Iron-containing alcohol dehydrogenase family protein n=1 Tax=Paenibacillus agricola TaxID=2716264 RepID=A0ABX0J0E9_9BACL|nr:iron-containing alcohol dehydrogenase family protein [Paenibacillus agricola]NHN29163.1 iron-containing alcohol dehydrogenase family protein [Paenibacillus agricola]